MEAVSAHRRAALRAVGALLSASGSLTEKTAKDKDKEKEKGGDRDMEMDLDVDVDEVRRDGVEKDREMEKVTERGKEREREEGGVMDGAAGSQGVEQFMNSGLTSRAPSPVPQPISTSATATAVPVTLSGPPVPAAVAAGQSSMPGGMCIDTLFASSPLLSDKDKVLTH